MRGVYGTVKPANIDIENDVEIFYYYRPTRSTESDEFSGFKTLDASCLVKATDEYTTDILGMYNLKLPLDKFNMKGIYTIYIRPKEMVLELKDVSVLAAYPDIRGVVINTSDVNGITDLTGYRIEYFNRDGSTRNENVRLITSSNRCEPILVSINDNFPKTTRYRLSDNASNYLFCTVTPSVASSYKPNYTPYIGVAGDKVAVINTKFNPVMLEVEMVEHDADTISYMLEGDQVRDRDNAVITTYNDQNEIYHQHDYYTIKSKLGTALYDVKQKRTSIDGTQSYDNVINNEQ